MTIHTWTTLCWTPPPWWARAILELAAERSADWAGYGDGQQLERHVEDLLATFHANAADIGRGPGRRW